MIFDDLYEIFFESRPGGNWYGPLYHGSRHKNIKKLSVKSAGSGIVGDSRSGALWFTSSIENARFYTDPDEEDSVDEFVYKVHVKMNNPLIVDSDEFSSGKIAPSAYVGKARKGGFDGVIIKDIVDGSHSSDIYAVWSDSQIRLDGPLKKPSPTISAAKNTPLDMESFYTYGDDGDFYIAVDTDDDRIISLGGPYGSEEEAEREAEKIIGAHNKAIGKKP